MFAAIASGQTTPAPVLLAQSAAMASRLGWGAIERYEPSTSPCQIVLFTEHTVLMTPYDALLPPTSRVPR